MAGTLPGGTAIDVTIDSPADGTLVASPPGAFPVTGTASIGEGAVVKDTAVVYALDRSGSMSANAGVDCDGVGGNDSRFVCAKHALATANTAAADPQSAIGETGLASFESSAVAHDVDLGAGGTQLIVAPDHDGNSNGRPDLEDVAFSLPLGFQTNYGAGLLLSIDVLNAATSAANVLLFLSDADHESVMVGSHVNSLAGSIPPNTTIHTFGMGSGTSCTFDGGTGSLNDIAALSTAGTGTCQVVSDISKLADFIAESLASELTAVEISVDGGSFQAVDTTSQPLPLSPGPGSLTYTHALSGLLPAVQTVCARASGTDAGGDGSTTTCHDITVADIAVSPADATNELTAGPQTHTVTATVAAGPDGGVAGRQVDFEVLSGPNAGETGSASTDAVGQAPFTYTATPGPSGLGTDLIRACFTDDLGNVACQEATKAWVDTTPPAVECSPTTNPGGNEPKAGNKSPGQNEDGFYELTAEDAVDPDPDVYVVDTGSGTVFGPFASGTRIKYTEDADATPEQKKMGGPNSEVQWHIIGNGDAAVHAVDGSGNQSDPVDCLVPAPPK